MHIVSCMMWRRPHLFDVARRCAALLLIAATLGLVVFGLVKIATVTLAVFAALLFTCLLWPVARWLDRWLPRSLACLAALLLAVGAVTAAFVWIVPAAISQIGDNRDQLTQNVRDLWNRFGQGPLSMDRLSGYLQKNSHRVFTGLGSGLVTATEFVGGLLLALVLTFFFLRDGQSWMQARLRSLGPERERVFQPAFLRAWKTLRGWIRGAALIALIDAAGIGLGLLVLGVPLALPIALLVFLGAFIPVLGATVTGAIAVLVAWATGGTTDGLITLGIVVAVQQLEGNVLEPLVMGRSIPLHPATVLIVVAAGALVGGIGGALASVPLTAVTVAFLQEVKRRSLPPKKTASTHLSPLLDASEEEAQPHAPH